MVIRTIEELKNHKKEITSKGLQTGIIYFWSSILNAVEERHIYADDCNEIRFWLTPHVEHLNKYDVEYIIFINNESEDSNGDLVRKISRNS